jgi:hypothetical protein
LHTEGQRLQLYAISMEGISCRVSGARSASHFLSYWATVVYRPFPSSRAMLIAAVVFKTVVDLC